MTRTEEKFYYRPIPCPACDVDRLEAWLEDMALEGLFLSSSGFMTGLGIFYRRQPQKMTYRLIPAKKPTSLLWDEDNGDPSLQEQADRERYGWEYLARYGDFHIYRSESPYATDLPTDRETREEALKILTKRHRGSIFAGITTGAVASAILEGKFLQSFIWLGTWRSLLILAVLASFLFSSVTYAVHYSRLLRRLREDDDIRREKVAWRSRAPWHYLFLTGQIVGVIATAWMLLSLWAASTEKDFRTPLDAYPGEPPFATLADLAGEDARYQWDASVFGDHNTYRIWGDPIAPYCAEWDESGDIYRGDPGSPGIFVSLSVEYFDTASSWLARGVAWEFWWGDYFLNRRYEEVTIPSAAELGVDWAIAYAKRGTHFPTIILQKGTRVYHAYFIWNDGLDLPDIARAMAAALQ